MFDQYGDMTVRGYMTIGGFVVGLLLLIAVFPFTTVSVGERVIVTRNGAIDRILAEGFHVIVPIIEDTITIDVTTQLESVTAQAASKDLQTVTANIAVNYQLNQEKIAEIYTQYRAEVDTRVIAPAVQEAVKAATAKYTAEELVTKRELVRTDIVDNLKEKVAAAHVTITNVSITNLDFSAQFNAAIEAKVQAEQDALTQKNLLAKVQYEADQRVATAEAEAKAIRLSSDAANNARYVELKKLEVQLEMAKKWDGQLPTNMYANVPLPMLNISQ